MNVASVTVTAMNHGLMTLSRGSARRGRAGAKVAVAALMVGLDAKETERSHENCVILYATARSRWKVCSWTGRGERGGQGAWSARAALGSPKKKRFFASLSC